MPITESPRSIRILTLNCWGLKYFSKYRRERLSAIGRQIAIQTPSPSIVALQECWCREDFDAIHKATRDILPYAKFYYSGVFGAGLGVLTAWPITRSSMVPFPLNGRPAPFPGDWLVGKGVACATVCVDQSAGVAGEIEIFNTHTHAAYDESSDSFICHRMAQAMELAKLMRKAVETGRYVIAAGDFNFTPDSKEYEIIVAQSGCMDVWDILHPRDTLPEIVPEQINVTAARDVLGCTWGNVTNTWHMHESPDKDIASGRRIATGQDMDLRSCRLDYIFVGDGLNVQSAHVCFDERIQISTDGRSTEHTFSDHFGVYAELHLERPTGKLVTVPGWVSPNYLVFVREEIDIYISRREWQRRRLLAILVMGWTVAFACLVAIWWSPRNFVAFLLALLSTVSFSAGNICGLVGGLSCTKELRLLREIQWETDLRIGHAGENG